MLKHRKLRQPERTVHETPGSIALAKRGQLLVSCEMLQNEAEKYRAHHVTNIGGQREGYHMSFQL